MDFFVITQERLLHHLEYDIRKSALGIMNWYVGERSDHLVLHVFLKVRDVNYLYRQAFFNKDEIHPSILQFMSSDRSVLGFASLQEEKPVIPEQTPLFDNLFTTGVVD